MANATCLDGHEKAVVRVWAWQGGFPEHSSNGQLLPAAPWVTYSSFLWILFLGMMDVIVAGERKN